MKRTMKPCQICGKPFYGGADCHYCPECARAKKLDTVVRFRSCQDCGTEFYGGPRARRCPDCAYKAQQETSRRHKKTGTARPLGSIDKCAVCGKEYIVKSGRQKYCSDICMRQGVLAWQREHKRGYHKASGQNIKKQERRNQKKKVCAYCLRTFTSNTSSGLCSDYCRMEHKKLLQCKADIARGYNRDLKKYEDKRDLYRKEVNP